MLKANIVLKNLKTVLKIKTDLELSKVLNVKPNTISSWKKRNSLQFEAIIDICETYGIDLNELFIENYKSPFHQDFALDNGLNQVRMIPSDLQFQYLLNGTKVLSELPVHNFPFLPNAEIAFQVISDNMVPNIAVSSYVICEQVSVADLEKWGVYVLVDRTRGIFVHRFKKKVSSDELLFLNDNSNYGEKKIKVGQIDELWSVKGCFTTCTNRAK